MDNVIHPLNDGGLISPQVPCSSLVVGESDSERKIMGLNPFGDSDFLFVPCFQQLNVTSINKGLHVMSQKVHSRILSGNQFIHFSIHQLTYRGVCFVQVITPATFTLGFPFPITFLVLGHLEVSAPSKSL